MTLLREHAFLRSAIQTHSDTCQHPKCTKQNQRTKQNPIQNTKNQKQTTNDDDCRRHCVFGRLRTHTYTYGTDFHHSTLPPTLSLSATERVLSTKKAKRTKKKNVPCHQPASKSTCTLTLTRLSTYRLYIYTRFTFRS